jgi:SAM-dependent methyltransferase
MLVEHAGVAANERVLEVGCGTGNLTIAISAAGAAVTGLDLSAPYVEFARRRVVGANIKFDIGDALNLPYSDGTFDRTLSMLTLDVLPDATRALAEMRRVTRPGGSVVVLVNDFRSGWTPFSLLWDTAAVLDPQAGAVRDEMVSKPLGWPGGLAALFHAGAFLKVSESRLGTLFEYDSFADYWSTFLTGQGKLGSYVVNLAEAPRRELERFVRAAYLCGLPDGHRAFTTWFWIVRGTVPDVA